MQSGKRKDPYAVAVQKDGLTGVCSVFVRHSGSIVCTITGARKHSTDLLREVWNCLALTPSMVLKIPSRRNVRVFIFANLHGFTKFEKITSRKNFYVYGSLEHLTGPLIHTTALHNKWCCRSSSGVAISVPLLGDTRVAAVEVTRGRKC